MLWFEPFYGAPLARGMRGAAFTPPVDVSVSDGDVVLTMDLPGLTAEDLEVEFYDGELIVRGERKRPELAKGTAWVHSERAFGRFERRMRLPEGIDADTVTASMDHGVLSLIVPKPERLKPRQIVIGGGEGAGEQRRLETTNA